MRDEDESDASESPEEAIINEIFPSKAMFVSFYDGGINKHNHHSHHNHHIHHNNCDQSNQGLGGRRSGVGAKSDSWTCVKGERP